jgi:hypothetical protein
MQLNAFLFLSHFLVRPGPFLFFLFPSLFPHLQPSPTSYHSFFFPTTRPSPAGPAHHPFPPPRGPAMAFLFLPLSFTPRGPASLPRPTSSPVPPPLSSGPSPSPRPKTARARLSPSPTRTDRRGLPIRLVVLPEPDSDLSPSPASPRVVLCRAASGPHAKAPSRPPYKYRLCPRDFPHKPQPPLPKTLVARGIFAAAAAPPPRFGRCRSRRNAAPLLPQAAAKASLRDNDAPRPVNLFSPRFPVR